jgi:hypothetical protein
MVGHRVVYFLNIGGALIERGTPIRSGRIKEMRVAKVSQRVGNLKTVVAYISDLSRAA